MRSSSDASERERYQRVLAAIFEVAQVLLTLHTVATLDARNLTNFVVENLAALLDDLQRGHSISQRLHAFHRTLDARLELLAGTAELDREAAAYQKLRGAMRDVDRAFAGIDAMTAKTSSNLNKAVRDVKDAFWRLAMTESPTDRALLNEAIWKIQAAIDESSSSLDDLGNARTLVRDLEVRDRIDSSVTVVDYQADFRSLAERDREDLHRSARDDLDGGMGRFDR